jgi:hypothetical protein
VRRVVLVFVLVSCRDKQAPAPAATATPKPATVTVAPALPTPEAPSDPNATPAQLFAAEQPDPAWKASTEKTLNDRLAKPGDRGLQSPSWHVECRRSKCQLAVTGTRQELSRDIDQLQELRDIAQNVVLTRPDEQPDGKLALRAYLIFARD